MSSRLCESWPIHWPRGETSEAMKLPNEIVPIHFVGIGGIGMSGIAEVLINLGHDVQGSDASDNDMGRQPEGAIAALRGPRSYRPPV